MGIRLGKILLILLIIVSSCNTGGKGETDAVLARAHDDYLYASDIQEIIIPGSSAKDSLIITKNYINNWIRKKLIVYQAERNLPESQMDFEKQLEDYRTSLIIYQYEYLLIQQQLDTIITNSEIEEYYQSNKQNFELKDNIVKVNYVIANQDDPLINRYKELLLSHAQNKRDSLLFYCERNAEDFSLDSTRWILFKEFLTMIPIETYNQNIFLQNNRYVELKDKPNQYFIDFIDFTVKDSISPLSFVEDNIRSIILNKRKIELIKNMHDEVFETALNENDIEIY